MRSTLSYFYLSIGTVIAAVPTALLLGYYGVGPDPISTLVTVLLLAVLEVSLSFDNAVVNASILKEMAPKWKHRFLTWGMLIAVFGMRLVFPIVIVCLSAGIGPISAVDLALFDPVSYEGIMTSAQVQLSAFGGVFLLMTALKYFTDAEKEVHWVGTLENFLTHHMIGSNVLAIVITVILVISMLIGGQDQSDYIVSGLIGLLVFMLVETLSDAIGEPDGANVAAGLGLSSFIYLEFIDASFSFDGVVGAFVLTNSMVIIAIGLGIGALFVRSITILLVDKGTLAQYKYLENGAFYAIFALAVIMLLKPIMEVPEVITGLIGVSFIGAAVISSKNE